ncbi:hypothetical protein FPV67DRAFT_1105765 [Lyophyllum atratum]|nr:hypothetical protein FPV67DRAFT_1105765 [Lyophyllum atratum]
MLSWTGNLLFARNCIILDPPLWARSASLWPRCKLRYTFAVATYAHLPTANGIRGFRRRRVSRHKLVQILSDLVRAPRSSDVHRLQRHPAQDPALRQTFSTAVCGARDNNLTFVRTMTENYGPMLGNPAVIIASQDPHPCMLILLTSEAAFGFKPFGPTRIELGGNFARTRVSNAGGLAYSTARSKSRRSATLFPLKGRFDMYIDYNFLSPSRLPPIWSDCVTAEMIKGERDEVTSSPVPTSLLTSILLPAF